MNEKLSPEQQDKIGRCVDDRMKAGGLSQTNKRTGKPFTKSDLFAICTAAIESSEVTMVKENMKFKFSTPLTVMTEGYNRDPNKRKIKGVMIKAATSRNGRTYLMEELRSAKFSADTMSLNHTEDVEDNVGLFTPIPSPEGFDFEGVVFNTARHPGVVEMLDKGLIKFVSIEAIAQKAERDPKTENIIVRGLDFTGLGLVKTPGFPEATVAISEALDINKGQAQVDNDEDDEEDLLVKASVPIENSGGNAMETTEAAQPVTEEKHKMDCPEGQHMVDGKCMPMEAKKESVNNEAVDGLKKTIESLAEEVKKLKEKKESKGIVTPTVQESYGFKIVKEKMKDGNSLFYAEDASSLY